MNIIKTVPIGIISVLWDYEDEELIKDAFYEFVLSKKNGKFEFTNKYFFLEDNLCVKCEDTKTYTCDINILDYTDRIKIQFCSDILFLTKEQYQLLNSVITDLQTKYKFEIKLPSSKLR